MKEQKKNDYSLSIHIAHFKDRERGRKKILMKEGKILYTQQ